MSRIEDVRDIQVKFKCLIFNLFLVFHNLLRGDFIYYLKLRIIFIIVKPKYLLSNFSFIYNHGEVLICII